MFWGLIMEPQRRYTQIVKKAFHVSMAALDISSADNEPAQVMCTIKERNYLLCTLQKNKSVQCALDLIFEVGDEVSFATNGGSHVHLTGYLTEDYDEVEEEDGEDEEEMEDSKLPKKRQKKDAGPLAVPNKKMKTADLLDAINSQEEDSDDSDVNLTDLMEDEDGEEEEEDEEQEAEEEEEDDEDEDESDDEDITESSEEETKVEPPKVNGTPHSKKLKQIQETKKPEKQKSPKAEKGGGDASSASIKQEKTPKKQKQNEVTNQQSAGKKRTAEGGVIIEELKQGDGQIAKPGRMVQVYYEGRLKSNNKLFDSTTKGHGFKFRLGKQEVIRGWDVGVSGMKVGGKRRIICPPNMAYGQKGSPPAIPPNSTLVFDIELKNVV